MPKSKKVKMYSCKYGVPMLVEGHLRKGLHTRKDGTTYQIVHAEYGGTYTTDKLKTWDELSDRQKYSAV